MSVHCQVDITNGVITQVDLAGNRHPFADKRLNMFAVRDCASRCEAMEISVAKT